MNLFWGLASREGKSAPKGRQEAAEQGLFALLSRPPAASETATFLQQFASLLKAAGRPVGTDPHESSLTAGAPALHLVARNFVGSPLAGELADALLGLGVPVDEVDRLGETALHAAVQVGNVPVIERLLAAHADPNKVSPAVFGNTIDMAVETLRYPDCEVPVEAGMAILGMLVAHGGKVLKHDNGRPDALILAAGGNDHGRQMDLPEAIELLLSAGADIDRRENGSGRMAIHYAFLRNYWRTAALLFRAGAKPYVRDEQDFIPADYAENGLESQHELRAIVRAAEMKLLGQASTPNQASD